MGEATTRTVSAKFTYEDLEDLLRAPNRFRIVGGRGVAGGIEIDFAVPAWDNDVVGVFPDYHMDDPTRTCIGVYYRLKAT